MSLPKKLAQIHLNNYTRDARALTSKVIKQFLPDPDYQTDGFTAEEEIAFIRDEKEKAIKKEYDHLFPVSLAYQVRLPLEILCCPSNLQLVDRFSNRSKSDSFNLHIVDLIKSYYKIWNKNPLWIEFLNGQKLKKY